MTISMFFSGFPRRGQRNALAAGAFLLFTLPLTAQIPVEEHPAIQTSGSHGIAVESPAPKPPGAASPAPAPGTAQALALEKRTADSAVTPFNRNRTRHQQFLDRAKLGKIDLLFVGDSITDFMPRTGEYTWLRFAPYNPANFGVSGERTEDVLWRMQNGELDSIHPKVVVLLIGTNNFGLHKAEQPEWVAAGVKKIVDTIHEKLPGTKVLLLGIFPRGNPDDPARPKIEAANTALAQLDDGKTTRLLDFGNKFLDEKKEIPRDVMGDKLHPTAKGYEIWWDAMHPLLEEMMTVASPTPGATPAATATPGAKPSASPAKGPKPK